MQFFTFLKQIRNIQNLQVCDYSGITSLSLELFKGNPIQRYFIHWSFSTLLSKHIFPLFG